MSENARVQGLDSYYTLGRSGLRVSPLCLGTMTFGPIEQTRCDDAESRKIFDRYLSAGGNFFDTADKYSDGESEKLLGQFVKETGLRDEFVLATKFTFSSRHRDPNAGGNGRKHIMDAVDDSLRRLQTDRIDLYWMHVWDTLTPVEEVMYTLDKVVASGKVRYIGFSDIPAWYLGRAQTLAEWRGWAPLIAIQMEYSLIMRNIEFEYVDAAHALGLGITPWSPLGGGMLTGKYRRPAEGAQAEGRLAKNTNPVFDKLTETNFKIVDVLLEVAGEMGRTPAQVALNWITKRRGVVSSIVGATKLSQLEDSITALDFEIPEELSAKLEAASRPAREFPYIFFAEPIRGNHTGAHPLAAETPWYR